MVLSKVGIHLFLSKIQTMSRWYYAGSLCKRTRLDCWIYLYTGPFCQVTVYISVTKYTDTRKLRYLAVKNDIIPWFLSTGTLRARVFFNVTPQRSWEVSTCTAALNCSLLCYCCAVKWCINSFVSQILKKWLILLSNWSDNSFRSLEQSLLCLVLSPNQVSMLTAGTLAYFVATN